LMGEGRAFALALLAKLPYTRAIEPAGGVWPVQGRHP